MKKFFMVMVLVLVQQAQAQTQPPHPFIPPGKQGTPAAPLAAGCPTAERAKLPVKCWKGQRIQFFSTPKGERPAPYNEFYFQGDKAQKGVPGEALDGKTGTIERIFFEFFVQTTARIRLDESGTTVNGRIFGNRLSGVVFLRDLESARKNLIGKAVWYKGNKLAKNATGPEEKFIVPGRLTKMTVTDVTTGRYENAPIRLITKTFDGQSGYVDVTWGQTNISENLYKGKPFEDQFFTDSPRKLFHFTEQQWQAIYSSKVLVGMTANAVTLAWGAADSVMTNPLGANGVRTEKWIYGDSVSNKRRVYFTNGLVSSVDN